MKNYKGKANLQTARGRVRDHPAAFDFGRRGFRSEPLRDRDEVCSGDLWGVLPVNGVIELWENGRAISPGVLTAGRRWQPVEAAAHPHVAKVRGEHLSDGTYRLRNVVFRPTMLLGERAGREPITKNRSLLSAGYAIGLIGRSYVHGKHARRHGAQLLSYDGIPELAKTAGGTHGLGYYDVANVWAVGCSATYPSQEGGRREVVHYYGHTRDTRDQSARVWGQAQHEHPVEQTARNHLADILGLTTEFVAPPNWTPSCDNRGSASKHRRHFTRGEIVTVCYDRGDNHTKRPPTMVPSLVLSPNELNHADFNTLIVLQLIPAQQGDDNGFFLPLQPIPYKETTDWTVHPALIRSVSDLDDNVTRLGTGYRLDLEQPEEFTELEDRLRILYG